MSPSGRLRRVPPKRSAAFLLHLASRSERRKEILREMKMRFRVVPSRYRERPLPGRRPEEIVRIHAKAKALHACVRARAARWVLGADTIVFCRGRMLGKPRSWAEAKRMLAFLSGKVHEVWTGLALWDRKEDRIFEASERTRVHFRRLSPAAIHDYLAQVPHLDKAGAYAIQMGPRIVRRIEGSYSNVVGLPRELLRRMLRQHRT